MALTKQQKQKILENLREMFSRQKAIILVGITGLKVKDISELRKKIKGMGGEDKSSPSRFANARVEGNLKVTKKTLAGLIFQENNLEFDKTQFKEELALVFGFKDEILSAKTVYQFSKENEKLKILGGYFENSFKEAEEIITLAQLPSKNELMARLVGGLKSPISNFVNVLEGNIKGLIYVLSTIKK